MVKRKPKPDWDICAECPHTVNIHTIKGEIGACRGYDCECKQYVSQE